MSVVQCYLTFEWLQAYFPWTSVLYILTIFFKWIFSILLTSIFALGTSSEINFIILNALNAINFFNFFVRGAVTWSYHEYLLEICDVVADLCYSHQNLVQVKRGRFHQGGRSHDWIWVFLVIRPFLLGLYLLTLTFDLLFLKLTLVITSK